MKKIEITDEIKLIASDFDGVFTDGTVFIDENLNFQKKVSFKDIMGVSMILKAGINFAIISGENSNILDYFKNKFNVKEIHKGLRLTKRISRLTPTVVVERAVSTLTRPNPLSVLLIFLPV